MAGFGALVQDGQHLIHLVGEGVHTVGVVPEDLEVRRGGLHGGQTAHGVVAVRIAVRVGVHRHAPDALDAVVILHKTLHHVHVRAGLQHGHRDQLEAEVLGDLEVTVITGGRAEELDVGAEAPGADGVHKARTPAQVDEIIHDGQRGVAAHQHLLGAGHAHHVGEEAPRLGNALQITVVPGIHTVLADVVLQLHHVGGKVQLLRAGLAAGHIQFQTFLLERVVLALLKAEFCLQRGPVHGTVLLHCIHSPLKLYSTLCVCRAVCSLHRGLSPAAQPGCQSVCGYYSTISFGKQAFRAPFAGTKAPNEHETAPPDGGAGLLWEVRLGLTPACSWGSRQSRCPPCRTDSRCQAGWRSAGCP